MKLKNKKIIFCLTGSFYTFRNTILQIKELVKEKANIMPVMSHTAYNTNTKFGKAKDFVNEIELLTHNKVIYKIKDAKELEFKYIADIAIIAPCTGNTIAKLSNGIVDNPVLIVTKSHLKNERPLVIGVSTNDGLSR